MTRYAIRMLPDNSHPCAISDPSGCFYSVGEVDREIKRLEGIINATRTDVSGTVSTGDRSWTCDSGLWDEDGADG